MFRMDEEQLQALLKQNPNLSISKHSVTAADKKDSPQKATNPKDGQNKYHNYPVYVYEDGFIFDSSAERLSRKEISQRQKALSNDHGHVKERFDSKKEYLRNICLKQMERAGTISQLKRQYRLIIQPAFDYQNEHLQAVTYCADFIYEENGRTIVEDVKGYDSKTGMWLTTQVFNLKWKLLKTKYPDYEFRLY